MRAARWGPPPYIPAPWAGFGASVKRKPRTGCYDPAVRQGTPATLLLPVSRIADLEPHRHFAPAFLGHPAARRRLEAPFRQRPLLRRLEKGRAVPAPQRSEEHTSEPQSLMRIPYAVFRLTNKTTHIHTT